MPTNMSYELTFLSVYPPESVTVNGEQVTYNSLPIPNENTWTYIGNTLSLVISLGTSPKNNQPNL
jgi:hypothetical protein